MRSMITLAAIAALTTTTAFAQVTAAGSGSTATAITDSKSLSVAHGGAGGQGGAGVAESASFSEGGSVSGVNATSTTGASTASATQDASNQGNSQSIHFNDAAPLKTQRLVTAPSIGSPGLTTTLSETCMGSVSAGITIMGGGAMGGKTYTDQECVIRLDAREVAQTLGDKEAARAIMCQKERVRLAYDQVGQPCPGTPRYAEYVAEMNAQALMATPPAAPAALPPAVTRMDPIPNPRTPRG